MLKMLLDQIEQKETLLKALLAKPPEDLTVDDAGQMTTLYGEIEQLDGQAAQLRSVEELRQKAAARAALATVPANPFPQERENTTLTKAGDVGIRQVFAVPHRGRVKHFKAKDAWGGFPAQSAEEQAARFGYFLTAALFHREKSMQWCKEHGVKILFEGVNERGGFLVPDEFESTIIDLKEMYGVFRKYADVTPMAGDTKLIPRRTGGATTYWVGEGDTITPSNLTWDQVQLIAKKLVGLVKMSTEVSEDAIIDIGDKIAYEIGYGFALAEDDAGWNGDASATYGGITGVLTKIKALSGTLADIAGLFISEGGNQYFELLLSDFNNVVGLLPEYADQGDAAWYCSRRFWATVMQKLALAAGGVAAYEVMQGAREKEFLGYPVRISQKMPSVEANSQVCCVFGDLGKAVAMGDRRQTTIAMSEHSDFASDLIAIRGTERLDINVHDVGNASATASLRVPGPLVGLLTKAS